MQRLEIPERYQQPTRQHQSTLMTEQDDWQRVPYRPDPDCPVCKGCGFVHPIWGGKPAFDRVVPCKCLVDSIQGKQPPEIVKQTFETFQEIPGAEKALKAAKSLADGQSKFIWLLLYGRPGNGKTHLCNAIAKTVRSRGFEVQAVLAADLFALLRESIEQKKADTLLRKLKEVFLLIIDDYGVEYGSEWEQAKFDELMTSRFAAAMPTVLATNKELTDLPERIQSRFMDKVMARAVYNSALDYRSTRKY